MDQSIDNHRTRESLVQVLRRDGEGEEAAREIERKCSIHPGQLLPGTGNARLFLQNRWSGRGSRGFGLKQSSRSTTRKRNAMNNEEEGSRHGRRSTQLERSTRSFRPTVAHGFECLRWGSRGYRHRVGGRLGCTRSPCWRAGAPRCLSVPTSSCVVDYGIGCMYGSESGTIENQKLHPQRFSAQHRSQTPWDRR